MTNFERITASLETLGEFLFQNFCEDGPWDEAFQAAYCASCGRRDCDSCPNEEQRHNPEWWLRLEAAPGQVSAFCAEDYVQSYIDNIRNERIRARKSEIWNTALAVGAVVCMVIAALSIAGYVLFG